MTPNEERKLLAVARDAAEAAAVELRRRFGDAHGVRSKSTPTDLVSDADLAAESAIRSILAERRPGDSILAEEGGESILAEGGGESILAGDGAESVVAERGGEATGGGLRWVVDPLDGTINYLFGIPAFAVSIACEDASGPVIGVVLDPCRDERFEATRSGEATLNGEAFSAPSRAGGLGVAMVATGFGYDAKIRARQADVLTRVLPRVRDIRRVGAAALDLCWCACGRFDAYYERGLNPWDVAAGTLIARCAGLEVRDLPAGPDEPAGTVAAPAGLIDELVALIVD